jgi:TolA-binding protein
MSLRPESAETVLKQVNANWTPARSAEVEARLMARLNRKRRVRLLAGVTLTSATVAAATVAAILVWRPAPRPLPAVVVEAPPPPAGETGALRFLDGTNAVATAPGSDLRVVEDTPARQTVKVVRGGARFQVAKAQGRVFRVELAAVVVEVLGTTFRVEEADTRVRVPVEEGRVRVQQEGGAWVELAAGEVSLFPAGGDRARLPEDGAPPQTEGPPSAPDAPSAGGPEARMVKAQRASGSRNPGGASRAVGRAAGRRDRVDDWMRAADAARQSGEPAAALPYLRAVTETFPRDDRAPVAAFTMALLLLEQLGRPGEAAEMFSQVVRLDTRGAPLTEDALARAVEAWRQAGNPERARQAAVEYLHRYPNGRRASSVRQLGGLR